MSWVRRDGDDLLLKLHVQPGASQTGIAGQHGDALKVRVGAAARDGRANVQVVQLLAKTFAVPRHRVDIEHGAAGRRKRVRIRGPLDEARLQALLARFGSDPE